MNELNSMHNDFVHGLRKDIEDLKADNERLLTLLRDIDNAIYYDDYDDAWLSVSEEMWQRITDAIRESNE